MEMRIKTSRLTSNLSILNTYAPGIDYEYSEITERREATNNYMVNLPKNLIECWCTDNNGQPQYTEENKNIIGKSTLSKKQPYINGLHLAETCD